MNDVVPIIPESAPFSAEQRAWLNGFFAGLFSRGTAGGTSQAGVHAAAGPKPALTPLTILFGSQTGTAETLAKRAAKEAGKRGFAATVLDMAQTDAAKLTAERNLLLITSTYGDGEPPDNAKALHTALATARSPAPALNLAALRYAVCALGDTNYTQFCKCGADFDSYLESLGASRVAPRVDCDVDYEEKFSAWLNTVLGCLSAPPVNDHAPPGGSVFEPPNSDQPHVLSAVGKPPLRSGSSPSQENALRSDNVPAPAYSRSQPYPARLRCSRNLNAPESARQVHHVEFDLGDSGLRYEAGDALGVFPHNCPMLVADVLAALGCDGEEAVPAPDGSTTSLRHALSEHYDLCRPTPKLLAHYGPAAGGGTAVAMHHVLDVILARAGLELPPAEFVGALKKLQPRLYSISSSPRAHADQVHLTVGVVRYDLQGRPRKGVCSTFLSERVAPDQSQVGIFVHHNASFRLPVGDDIPIIMIGPGTGVAPFRAFLHERKARGATGRNWLFFGDQRAATDFLYRDELATLMHEGVLTRLDTAFSRDQAEKIYVQHRMLEQAVELHDWLENGAHLYVCGNAARMAKDVDAALHHVIERAGGKTPEQAAEYVQALRAAKRYSRDVY